jgi:hypothetical protein
MHNILDCKVKVDVWAMLNAIGDCLGNYQADVIADTDILCLPDAALADITVYQSVTDDGYSLHEDLVEIFDSSHYISQYNEKQ